MLPGNLLATVLRHGQEALRVCIVGLRWRGRYVAPCPPIPLNRGKATLVHLLPGSAWA